MYKSNIILLEEKENNYIEKMKLVDKDRIELNLRDKSVSKE